MLPHKHVLISVTIGAVALLQTGEVASGVVALAAGVAPDMDHVVDYLYFHRRGTHRLILPLHGYEYVIVGSAIALLNGSHILAIAVLSYLVHLLADQAENRTKVLGYSILFRAVHRFRVEAVSTMPEAAIRGRVDDIRRLQQWLLR